MGFVNERVSDEDAKKYGFEALGTRLGREEWQLKQGWTIDRTRNIFLIWLGRGQEEFSMQQRFLLWWDGQEITVSINGSGKGNPFETFAMTWDSPAFSFPDDLKPKREEVISTFKDALIKFKWGAYDGQQVDFTANFNF